MKKFLALVLCLTLVLTCFTALFGCGPGFRTYTHGDWVIMHSAEGECLIFDLSEEGKQKEVLIFPTEVAGRKVTGTYYEPSGWYHNGHCISALNLKRLYFTEYTDLISLSIIVSGYQKFFIMYEFDDDLSDYIKDWTFYLKKTLPYKQINGAWPANVSYYYNYENAPFDGYYWLDDYGDYEAEIIKYPPQNPVREGYEFAGWYKEPECVNKWNFETDLVPKKKYDPNSMGNTSTSKKNYVYVETPLYAKWNKI